MFLESYLKKKKMRLGVNTSCVPQERGNNEWSKAGAIALPATQYTLSFLQHAQTVNFDNSTRRRRPKKKRHSQSALQCTYSASGSRAVRERIFILFYIFVPCSCSCSCCPFTSVPTHTHDDVQCATQIWRA
jgi:hypothetical protein